MWNSCSSNRGGFTRAQSKIGLPTQCSTYAHATDRDRENEYCSVSYIYNATRDNNEQNTQDTNGRSVGIVYSVYVTQTNTETTTKKKKKEKATTSGYRYLQSRQRTRSAETSNVRESRQVQI